MRDIFKYRDNFALYANVESKLLSGNPSLVPHPEVSVVMPVYKRPDYMMTALRSVLEQTFTGSYEIVVVDNNDTIEGANNNRQVIELLQSEKILYYHNEKNIGMIGNWNRCIELARAPYIVYCHDDDMLLPDALRILMKLKFANPDKAIFGAKNTIGPNGEILSMANPLSSKKLGLLVSRSSFPYKKEDVFIGSPGYGCGCLFEKKHLLELGGFDAEFYPSSDYALNAVYIFNFGGIFSRIPTFNYRIAENESLKVYEQFVEVDKHFRLCMISRMKWPRPILNRIIQANYRVSKINFAIYWSKEDASLRNQIQLSDKIIMKLIGIKLAFKHWTLLPGNE